MKRLISLICLVGIMAISLPVFADNVWDDISDTLKGRNEDLPLNLYVAKTISLEKVPFVNILNADLRMKVSTPYGEEFCERGELSIGLEF
jgi:hypothetical protein